MTTLNDVKLVEAPASLNRGAVREWVDALRSGKFPQTAGYLRTNDGYCCLGVLTEAVCGIAAAKEPGAFDEPEYRFDGALTYPPSSAYAVLGVEEEDFGICPIRYNYTNDPTRNSQDIAHLNDAEGWSFEQIADLIERDWL